LSSRRKLISGKFRTGWNIRYNFELFWILNRIP
jgi:hypothetical protein